MKAVTWQGTKDLRVDDVPDPRIQQPTDAIVKLTSTAICGSDLHLYNVLGMWLSPGDVIGHEPMGVVEEIGSEVSHIKPGDRVVIPFNIACGSCWMCSRGLMTQCETTQVKEHHKGAQLFGYTALYGSVPGAQAEYLRVPQAHFGPIKVPDEGPDERYLFLSDILPTAWQGVEYADLKEGNSCVVVGLGPVGQFAARVAAYRGADPVIGIDNVPERLAMAQRNGIQTINTDSVNDVGQTVADLTAGRGADSVVEAVGMEAHGSPVQETAQKVSGMLPDSVAQKVTEKMGVDRMSALYTAFAVARRGGTVSISGVYGGQADPLPMMELFDKQISIRMGQANVKRWVDDILPLVSNGEDPLNVEDLTTHKLSLQDAIHGYDIFEKKQDGCVKVVLQP